MIQLVPQLKILLAFEPVDFRKGIDSLLALCRNHLQQDPFSVTVFLFRNQSGTAVKLLVYDGTGFWLCQKRFSSGKLRWWPNSSETALHQLAAHELSVLLYNGHPLKANFSEPWRQLS